MMTLDPAGIIVGCPACGQRNRLGYERLDRKQRCGSCGGELPAVATPVDVMDAAMFFVLIRRSALPVVADFWAGWCGPCLMMAPELKKVAAQAAGRALVCKVNTEDHPGLAQAHQISSLPTLSLLWQGREVARIMGARPAPAVLDWLQHAAGHAGISGPITGG